MNIVIDYLLILAPLMPIVALLALIIWLVEHPLRDNNFVARFTNARTMYHLLLGLTMAGVVYNLDECHQMGCFVTCDPDKPTKAIFFGIITSSLLSLGYFSTRQRLQLSFLSFELIVCLSWIFYCRANEDTGFAGIPSDNQIAHGFLAIMLRLALIKKINKVNVKNLWILITALVVVGISITWTPFAIADVSKMEKLSYSGNDFTKKPTKDDSVWWVNNPQVIEEITVTEVFYDANYANCNLTAKVIDSKDKTLLDKTIEIVEADATKMLSSELIDDNKKVFILRGNFAVVQCHHELTNASDKQVLFEYKTLQTKK